MTPEAPGTGSVLDPEQHGPVCQFRIRPYAVWSCDCGVLRRDPKPRLSEKRWRDMSGAERVGFTLAALTGAMLVGGLTLAAAGVWWLAVLAWRAVP